ncbi:MAG: hypothetical protein AB7F35_00535 [Acetobacteraceae bacterium]
MNPAFFASVPPTVLLDTLAVSTPVYNQNYTVLARTRFLWVVMWGGGGEYGGYDGGAGGFVQALVPVTVGEILKYSVAQGGWYGNNAGSGAAISGGGSDGYSGFGGDGGGASLLMRGTTPLLIAGGGGGGTSGASTPAGRGGAAGGTTGQNGDNGTSSLQGKGGSQSAGGQSPVSGNVYPFIGGYLRGGSSPGTDHNGSGGGGYYGGGVGQGGGGGSSYIGATGNLYASTEGGDYATAPATAHDDYVAGIAAGGTSGNARGGNGLMVIRAYSGDPVAAGLITP